MEYKRYGGLLVSEWMTAGIIVVVGAVVAFGFLVGGERDAMVEQAEASLVEMQEWVSPAVESAVSRGTLLTCDGSMVDPGMLANEFLTLSVRALPVNTEDFSEGYMPSVYVEASEESDGNDTFVTAKRLHSSLDDAEAFEVRLRKKEDEEIAFSVILSASPVCTEVAGQATPESPESQA